MNVTQLAGLLSDTEYMAYRAGRAKEIRHACMGRARLHKDSMLASVLRLCVERAREANHEYIRHAVALRNQKDLEAQRREDYRQTLRQY